MIQQGTFSLPSDNPLGDAIFRINKVSAFLDNSCSFPKRWSCLAIRNSVFPIPLCHRAQFEVLDVLEGQGGDGIG